MAVTGAKMVVDSKSLHNTPTYWQSLGKFVQQFSEAEREAQILLWYLTSEHVEVAFAIYREKMNLNEVIELCRKLYRIRVADDAAATEFDVYMIHFSAIAEVRNKLLHNGTTFTDEGAQVIQRLKDLRSKERAPPMPMSAECLDAMSVDCGWIESVCWSLYALQTTADDWRFPSGHESPSWKYQPTPAPNRRPPKAGS
jgi:hypothetical protein